MWDKLFHFLKQVFFSRYVHLFMGLLALYGVSWLITFSSHFEKVMDTFKRYCYADYEVRKSLFQGEVQKSEFYREKYKERLSSLAEGFFDYRDQNEMQAFFMPKGLLYDVWREKNRNSYLLAQVIEKGQHKAGVLEEVAFNYIILGDKKIVPFSEYEKGWWGKTFVSAGENGIYIHKDTLEPILRWYFESLWITEPKIPKQFHWDPLSYSLYRDLSEICEDIFIKRLYTNKQSAQDYFIEEGFKVFLPTLFAMSARMVADQDSNFRSDYRYLRACLTGLSLNPNHTMFYLLKVSSQKSYNPLVRRGWESIRQRLDITYMDDITLEQISIVAQDILKNLEDSIIHKKYPPSSSNYPIKNTGH